MYTIKKFNNIEDFSEKDKENFYKKIGKNMMYDKKFTYDEKDFEINPKIWKYEYIKEEYYSSLYGEDFFVLDLV